ncbi:MAG: hypothetical protein WD035_12090 [Balneolaceae bacterium]
MTSASLLQLNDYRTTAMVGKWHLTPTEEQENESTGTSSNLRNRPSGKGFLISFL